MKGHPSQITVKFLCWVVFGNRPIFYFVIFCYMCVKMTGKRFFVSSVPSKAMKSILDHLRINDVNDVDNCILVPSNILPYAKTIPFWVELCVSTGDAASSFTVIRSAMGVELTGSKGKTLIVSEILFHNIKYGLLKHGISKPVERLRYTVRIMKDSPTFADCLELSSVKVPLEKRGKQHPLKLQIESLFKDPRYVQAGDILFASNLEEKAAFCYAVRVQGKEIAPGFLVSSEKAKIEQGPEMKGYVPSHSVTVRPSSDSTPVTATNFKDFLIDICPPWLQDHAVHLAMFLQPFLLPTDNSKELILKRHRLPVILISGPRGSGKRTVLKRAAQGAGVWDIGSVHVHHHNLATLRGTGPGSVEKSLSTLIEEISQLSPCIVAVHSVEWLALGRDGPDEGRGVEAWLNWLTDLQELRKGVIAVVATTRMEKFQLPAPLARTFVGEISLHQPPDLIGRENLLKWTMGALGIQFPEEVPAKLAQHTAGFLYADLASLVSGSLRNKYIKLKNNIERDECIVLEEEDFKDMLASMHAAYSDAIGAPKIPCVAWEDVGGLADIREEILMTIEFPIKYPELVKSGLKRTGILLYGPPGTGKTLMAKAVATECSFNFISVKGPELLNMYVGQSEANVREVFQRARGAAPCIIFFDELDSLAPNRGRTGDSGGVMDRVVSQLLAEMDGHEKMENVFVMAATNRPDLVDSALLRPGRFDKLLYVGPYEDRKSQLSVMAALTRKFNLAPDVILEDIVSLLPERLSGADMQAVCSGAMMKAIEREVRIAETVGEDSDISGASLQVTLEDFQKSLTGIKPSISEEELLHFKRLRLKFEK